MWMTELATNTMTAESRMGSQRAVRETMRSLLVSKDKCRNLREAIWKTGCGQGSGPKRAGTGLAAEDNADPGEQQVQLQGRQLPHALDKKIFIHAHDLGDICNGIFWQAGEALRDTTGSGRYERVFTSADLGTGLVHGLGYFVR